MRTALTAKESCQCKRNKGDLRSKKGISIVGKEREKITVEALHIQRNDTNGLLPHFGIDSLHILKLPWYTASSICLGIGMARTDLTFEPKLPQNFQLQ